MTISSPEKLTHPSLIYSGVEHGFFGRKGGISKGIYRSLNCGAGSNDDPQAVLENRKRAVLALSGTMDTPLVTPYQIHSARCLAVSKPWDKGQPQKADALATRTSHLIIAVCTADCGPVLLCDPKNKVIAAAHAGWKGAFGGILEETIRVMETLGARLEHIIAVLGPTISQTAYQVDADYYHKFVDQAQNNARYFVKLDRENHFYFDLPHYICDRLQQAGIAQVVWTGHCTYQRKEQYFSYRRSTHAKAVDYGRQLAAICLF